MDTVNNERELLELAAKAIGIDSVWWTKDGKKCFRRNGGEQKPWNPREHNGDSFELLVRLNLVVECTLGQSAARTFGSVFAACVDHSDKEVYPNRPFDPDPESATRLAILICAAKIGREMK